MKVKSKSNLYSGLVVTFVGAIYYISSLSIRITKVGGAFHSRLVPQWIAVLLVLMGFILMSRDIIPWIKSERHKDAKDSVVSEKHKGAFVSWCRSQKDVFLIFFISFAYVGLLEYVGFRISTPVFLFCFITILSPHKTLKSRLVNVGFSLLVTTVLFLLFRYGFNMMLPRGILF